MLIRVSSKFRKSYKKLPKNVREKATEKEQIFRANAFDTRLDTHKLHGKYKEFWAFTVVNQYRIMFAFVDANTADFVNIGTHDIYK
ncbi:MAG: type II toxin-antitoxin system mRNA interferase toxin, RelE/StbE family [Patescibacteria group bacterium]|mgnify:CR=1 FL=1